MARLVPTTTTLSSRDARRLADFYQALLGWERVSDADDGGWVVIAGHGRGHRLAFHEDVEHRPPVWPSRPDREQMQVHLEIATDDLAGAVAHAVSCGAVEAVHQPQHDVRVMLDPDGHPFCLYLADPGRLD